VVEFEKSRKSLVARDSLIPWASLLEQAHPAAPLWGLRLAVEESLYCLIPVFALDLEVVFDVVTVPMLRVSK
jgi:hypothetical protein